MCRVTVFGPSPLQWICGEWIQKLGFDKATACFGGKEHTESDGPASQGEGTPRSRMGIPNRSRSHVSLLPFSGPPSSSWSSPLSLGDLCCYIFLFSVHLPPTLVNHPCLSSSAHPIGHSFWRSVSCCGPHYSVQGSHPHQWGQGVSCGYLIWRWRLLLGLSLPHSPMASPYGLESLLRSSSGLPRATWRVSLPWFWPAEERVVLGSTIWWSGFSSFVLGHFFLLGMGLGLDIKWAGVPRSFGPTCIIKGLFEICLFC